MAGPFRVEVYKNLHRGTFSIRCRQLKRIVGYGSTLALRDVCFFVGEAGRQRVIRRQEKEVHAYVRGVLADSFAADTSQMRQATYNPYKGPTFTDRESGVPVLTASVAVLVHPTVFYLP